MTKDELIQLVKRKTQSSWSLTSVGGVESMTIQCMSPLHEDRRPSATVTLEGKWAGYWRCWACGARGRITEDEVSLDVTPKDLREMIEPEEPESSPMTEEFWRLKYMWSGSHGYWVQKRGFSLQIVNEFLLGADQDGNPVYPAQDADNGIVGPVRRMELDNGQKTYLYPKGFKASHNLYGLTQLRRRNWETTRKHLFLVEGATDVMRTRSRNHYVVGIYGSILHAPQIELIRELNPNLIILMFDNDEAGFRATRLANDLLARDFPIRVFRYPASNLRIVEGRWMNTAPKDPDEFFYEKAYDPSTTLTSFHEWRKTHD